MLSDFFFTPERQIVVSPPVVQRREQLQSRGLTALDCLRAASWYDTQELKDAIRCLKYRRATALADALGQLIAERAGSSCDGVLCPVPLHWTRRLTRGFNQAALLSRVVGDAKQLPVRNLLKRTQSTGSQTGRCRAERLQALTGAFALRTSSVPRRVILIDDLSTTGATLDACARELKSGGCTYVEGWVIAHG